MSYSYAYALKNEFSSGMFFTLDCTKSKNMQFEEKEGICTRWVEPGDLVFFMHIEAASEYDDFIRGTEIKYHDTAGESE
jgi:hypothetical protein